MVVVVVGGGERGEATAACRWNPAKEQIKMLENLYRQGLKTPRAEQIEEITNILRPYGQIQPKNVFYWFQNHKARQKLQHHRRRRRHNHPSVLPPPPSPANVFCESQYGPQSDFGPPSNFGPPYSTTRRAPWAAKLKFSSCIQSPSNTGDHVGEEDVNSKKYGHQETLELFPLHPTGILQKVVATTTNI